MTTAETTGPNLPEIIGELPARAFDLANEALRQTFPSEYGQSIPPVTPQNVYVTSDDEVRRYYREAAEHNIHSTLRREDSKLEDATGQRFDPTEKIWTVKGAPGSPIIYGISNLEAMQRQFRRFGPSMSSTLMQALVARELVHEGLHRSGATGLSMPVDYRSPLFYMPFAAEKALLHQTPPGSALLELRRDRFEALFTHAYTHPSELLIEGASIKLLSEDGDGRKKIIANAGEELEENLVEIVGHNAYGYILGEVERKLDGRAAMFVAQIIKSVQHPHNMRVIHSYLGQLGLLDTREILEAFTQGSLPHKHLEHLPDTNYPG